jgi:hypothetical protein
MYYILPYLDLYMNVLLLFAILLTPTNWNAFSRRLQPLVLIVSLPIFITDNGCASEHLKLNTIRKRRHHLNALLLIQVYLGSTSCRSL